LDHSTENISVAQKWIYANHVENTSCDTGSIVVFTALLRSKGSYPIVAYVFVAVGMCLTSRSLAMGLNVTISWRKFPEGIEGNLKNPQTR
jgi:hypothetical protein